jgi:hypothetical protein
LDEVYHFHQNVHIHIYIEDHYEETMIQYQQVHVLRAVEMMMLFLNNRKNKVFFLSSSSYHHPDLHQVKILTFDFVGKV